MFDFIFPSAYAQTAAAGQPNPLMSLVPFVFIFIIFYFLMIRPQKKRMQQEQEMLKSLTKGDEIFTKSGLLGTIHGMTDRVITLEVAEGVRIKVLRSEIAGQAKKIFEAEQKDQEKKSDKKEEKKD